MATNRTEIDQDVERAFDLLGHYKGFLCDKVVGLSAEELERVLRQLEDVLREWLPRALAAGSSVIKEALASVGDRQAAARLLADVELWPARIACLEEVARASIPTNASPSAITVKCREEIRHWRTLLPMIRGFGAQRYVDRDDRHSAMAVSFYWSARLDSRPSRLGASFFLAAACDAVAAAAHRAGTPKATLRPAIRLAHRLRSSPDWTHLDAFDLLGVLDEQLALVGEVEELLAEIDLGPADGSQVKLTAAAMHDSPAATVSKCQPPAEEEAVEAPAAAPDQSESEGQQEATAKMEGVRSHRVEKESGTVPEPDPGFTKRGKTLKEGIAAREARMTPDERQAADARRRQRDAQDQKQRERELEWLRLQHDVDQRAFGMLTRMNEQMESARKFQDAIIRIGDNLSKPTLPPACADGLQNSTEASMVIRIPGDRSKAEEALRRRKLLEAEESERRRSEVEDAIAQGDLVRMAALWLDRSKRLASNLSGESVRDMNRLTPELAHAANAESLPYQSMLLVRTLTPDPWLYNQTPMIQLLVRAALEVEKLRFACEAKARRSQTTSPPSVSASESVVAPPGVTHTTPSEQPLVSEQAPRAEPETVEQERPNAPVLAVGQLPAMVLVTLQDNGGEMVKAKMKQLPGVRDPDRRNLANLLTPSSDLVSRGFLESIDRKVRLTAPGHAEARAQKQNGTKSLAEKPQTHGNSGSVRVS